MRAIQGASLSAGGFVGAGAGLGASLGAITNEILATELCMNSHANERLLEIQHWC